MRYRTIDDACIHVNICSAKPKRETIQTPWCRAIKILTIYIVVGAMTGTLEAITVITERHCTAEMHTFLIQCSPVGTITILHNGLRVQLILKECATQQKLCISRKVNNVRFRTLLIKDTFYIQLVICQLRGGWKICFLTNRDGRAELTCQIGIEHVQRTGNGCCRR